jgi:hypothetical protein
MKLITASNKAHESRTVPAPRTPGIFENGRAVRLTTGSDVDTDENLKEQCLDGAPVIARD